MLALEELLPGWGSALFPLTVAVFLIVVRAAALTFTVMCNVAPFNDDNESGMRFPMLQVTVLLVLLPEQLKGVTVQLKRRLTIEQLSVLPEALMYVVPAGKLSVTTTPVAFEGPRSVRPMA